MLFNEDLEKLSDPKTADTTLLAYLGDAVYEVYVRSLAAGESAPGANAGALNRFSVGYVKADSQALAAKEFLAGAEESTDSGPDAGIKLTEEESALVKRARNRTNTPAPRGSSPKAYKLATGLEALIGWLYVKGDEERLTAICRAAIGIIDSDKEDKNE